MQVLGLDVGNAKCKICWLDFKTSLEDSNILWGSYPLPFSRNRQQDFEEGLLANLGLFASDYDLQITQADCVVVCSSHSYSYPKCHESIVHLAKILTYIFSSIPVYFVSADGQLTSAPEIFSLSTSDLYAFVLTNFYGSAYLGSKLIKQGISLDIGTTTTDIIPICNGHIDPMGLKNPAQYLRFRYQNWRINWWGVGITQLCALTDRVVTSTQSYQIIPNYTTTDVLFSLLELNDPELMTHHAYFHRYPSAQEAAKSIAQFVGLDLFLLSQEEVLEIAYALYQKLIEKVMNCIQSVIDDVFEGKKEDLEIASFALGENCLAKPALLGLGFKEYQIKNLQLKRSENLWSASSVFAMTLKGLEYLKGEKSVILS